MEHKEYIRIVRDSDTAVLMIHGICGSPGHFEDLLPAIPADWSVYSILLAGHGGDVSDFAASSMKMWKAQVNARLEELLERYERVLLIGHSMGTLFAVRAAIDHPRQIPALFLLAVPLRIKMPVSTMIMCLRVAWGAANDADALAMAKASSIKTDRRLWRYVPWTPRFLELLAEVKRIRRCLPELKTPTFAFQSRRDELVSLKACRDLDSNPVICTRLLEQSTHFRYHPDDLEFLRGELTRLTREQYGQEK